MSEDTLERPEEAGPETHSEPVQSAAPEEASAPLDIESLLSEFDAATGQKQPNAPDTPQDAAAEDYSDLEAAVRLRNMENNASAERLQWLGGKVANEMQAFATAKFVEAHERDLGKFIDRLGDAVSRQPNAAAITKEMMSAWVDAKVRDLPEVQKAWLNREQSPQACEKVLRALEKDFIKAMTPVASIDPNVTEDRELVAAAVRGATRTGAPEDRPPDYGRASNQEFSKSVREQFGFDPGV